VTGSEGEGNASAENLPVHLPLPQPHLTSRDSMYRLRLFINGYKHQFDFIQSTLFSMHCECPTAFVSTMLTFLDIRASVLLLRTTASPSQCMPPAVPLSMSPYDLNIAISLTRYLKYSKTSEVTPRPMFRRRCSYVRHRQSQVYATRAAPEIRVAIKSRISPSQGDVCTIDTALQREDH
jgi:hypothetical protein